MLRKALGQVVLILTVIFVVSCSSVNDTITEPRGPADPSNVGDRSTKSNTKHQQLGVWQFTVDPAAGTLDVTLLRGAAMHLNALVFLEPPPLLNLTLESLEFNGNIIEADIGLRHPFVGLTEFSGFDVCGILITNGSVSGFSDADLIIAGSGDTRLLNPDGYSRWWNPAEFPVNDGTMFCYTDGLLGAPDSYANYNSTINGYKFYCDDLSNPNSPLSEISIENRALFSAGQQNIRHYTIELGSDGLVFNYAIDACWAFPTGNPPWQAPDDFPPEANRPETYRISIAELDNSLFYIDATNDAGGNLQLLINVWDHFNSSLNQVHAESLAGLPLTSALTPIGGGEGYSTYQLDFTGENLTQNGEAELLITVQAEATGYDGFLPGKPVCAYFTRTFNISSGGPAPGNGWARTWGGTGFYDAGFAVAAVDASGNSCVTGRFSNVVDFDPDPLSSDNHASNGGFDVFLSKLNSNGDFQWARTWGGADDDQGLGVTIDNSGDVYITGKFSATVDLNPDTGVDNHSSNGNYDIFLVKLSSAGDFQWACTWGGTNDDDGLGVATDSPGNVYVTGSFCGTVDFDPGSSLDNHTSHGLCDTFLSKFNSNGDFQWARTWGGNNIDKGFGVSLDDSGNAFIAGLFYATCDFDPGSNIDNHSANGLDDAFLSKFNSSGDYQWARTWGGSSYDGGFAVALDSANFILVTGFYSAIVDFDPGPATDNHAAIGQDDVFLSKFNASGDYQWARTWGGPGFDFGHGVAVGNSNSIYVAGDFFGTVDFDPGPAVDQHASNSATDAYLSKLDSNGDYQWARTWGGILNDYSYSVATDNTGCAYVAGSYCSIVDFDPGPEVDNHSSNGWADIFLVKFKPDGYW